MGTQDLMEMGRKNIKETDQSLIRSERLVNDTISIGAQTAETLQVQGQQLSKISNDLDDIHFSMKKAQQVIRDMARGLATDKCLMGFLLLVVIAIVVVIVLKITGVGNVKV
jgi:SNARE protein